MGKIGSYEYPDIEFSEAIKLARIIEDKFSGSIKTKDSLKSFASLVGHRNVRSGGFIIKTLALKRYGLLENHQLTETAEIILHPKGEAEKQKAIKKIIEDIELFRQLYQKIGKTVPEDKLWEYIVAITSVSRQDAISASGKVKRIYSDLIKYVKKDGLRETVVSGEISSEDIIELKSGDFYIKVPRTSDSISIIIDLLRKWKEKEKKMKK